MTAQIGTYSFLPWLRRGVASVIAGAPSGVRATMSLAVDVTGTRPDGNVVNRTIPRTVQLYGPGDIVGIDTRAIVRLEPRRGITDFESNYLAAIEFYDEDFPWRYTPGPPDSRKRLVPWITLVVLRTDEFTEVTAPSTVPSSIDVADPAASLPGPDELWAWAHVHVNATLTSGADIVSDDANAVIARLDATLATDADRGLSRLLSSRHLEPNTAYEAFVIPTFESGRLAGTGHDPAGAPGAMHVAWAPYAGQPEPTRFCYYVRWSFRTGIIGDFEYLVRLLQPRPADPKLGQRDIDVQAPAPGVPGLSDASLRGVLRLGGALAVPANNLDANQLAEAQRYEHWDGPGPHPMQVGIARLVNLTEDYRSGTTVHPDPVIAPPLYGQWHAQTSRLLDAADGPARRSNWVHELNLDPRFRAPASFGTAVVQDNQENYMSAAWNQVGDVLDANRRIRLGQFGRAVFASLHRRHLAGQLTADPGRVLALTAPLHRRALVGRSTVGHQVSTSVMTTTPTSATMRRVARPGARVVRRLGPSADVRGLVTAVAIGRAVTAPPKSPLSGVPTLETVISGLERGGRSRPAPASSLVLRMLRGDVGDPRDVRKLALDPDFDVRAVTGDRDDVAPAGRRDSATATRFKEALLGTIELFRASIEASAVAPRSPLDARRLAAATVAAIDPEVTVARRVFAGITIPERLRPPGPVPPLREVMAYPQIDVPMYQPLVARSVELLLPNINLIPQNTISILETNRRFIESYLVGVNHEMARELLWREYPTDQRGSYFRQFWDPSSQLGSAADAPAERRERLRDIPPLHTWNIDSALGTHNHRNPTPGAQSEDVVLVIRGDLLKRYPTAVVYAHHAQWVLGADRRIDPSAERVLDRLSPAEEAAPPPAKVLTPLYEAKVDPDIYFFGFALTVDEANGDRSDVADARPGWFFVIRERPGEPRFGFDIERVGPLQVWNDLAWPDVTVNGNPFVQVGATATTRTVSEPTAAADQEKHEQWTDDRRLHFGDDLESSEIAYIAYQAPVLVAVHANEMLGHG